MKYEIKKFFLALNNEYKIVESNWIKFIDWINFRYKIGNSIL